MTVKKPKNLKYANRHTVINYLREQDDTSVAQIVKLTGMSRTIVMRTIRAFQEQQFVVSIGKGSSTEDGGKRPELFRFNPDFGCVAASHIFPEHIFTALFDMNGTMISSYTKAIEKNMPIEELVDKIWTDTDALLQKESKTVDQLKGLVVGTHGITDGDTGIVHTSPHFPSWGISAHFKELLDAKRPHQLITLVDNQIRYQTFAEWKLGQGKGCEHLIVVEGGLGLVAGIVSNGRILHGNSGLAGEFGHMCVDPGDGIACHCGNDGCLENKISVAHLNQRIVELKESHPESSLPKESVELSTLAQHAQAGDALASQVLNEAADWIARGLSLLCLGAAPQRIIIQGLYAAAGDSFYERLNHSLSNYLPKVPSLVPEVLPSTFGEERCAIGASHMLIDAFFNDSALYE